MGKPAVLNNPFVNRVIGSGEESPEQLLANPANFRIHPDFQQQSLAGSIDSIGYIDPVLVNKRTGMVIDGHLRVALALRSNVKSIPVTYVDLSEDEEKLALLSLDPIAAMANADRAKLDDLLHQVNSDDERVQQMLAEIAEREHLQYGEPPPDAPEPQVDRAEELRVKWGVETGQLWEIGRHRIICGDCTDPAVVARVMGGERAALIWTDPPYGVKYGDKLESANPMGYRVRTIENDDLPADQLEEFIRSALKLAAEFSDPGSAIYVACPAGTPLPALISSFAGSGFEYHWGLVWLKDQLVLSRADYHFRHENILYGWKPDGAHYFTDDRTQDSVFVVDRPKRSEEHPTMKPVELVERMVTNSSRKDSVVYDPFLGSGTTLVACERLNRVGRGIEISPGYVAVSLQRLADMGLEPKLLDN